MKRSTGALLFVLLLTGLMAVGCGVDAEDNILAEAMQKMENALSYTFEGAVAVSFEGMEMEETVLLSGIYEKPDKIYTKMEMPFFGESYLFELWTEGDNIRLVSDHPLFTEIDLEEMAEFYSDDFSSYDPQQYQELFLKGAGSVEQIANPAGVGSEYVTFKVVADREQLKKMVQEQMDSMFLSIPEFTFDFDWDDSDFDFDDLDLEEYDFEAGEWDEFDFEDFNWEDFELAMEELMAEMMENMTLDLVTIVVVHKEEQEIKSLDMSLEINFPMPSLFGEDMQELGLTEGMKINYNVALQFDNYNEPVKFPPYN